MSNGPYVKRSHNWGAPPPGQGSDKTCRRCGARFHVVGKDSECGAVDPEVDVATSSEYDPMGED